MDKERAAEGNDGPLAMRRCDTIRLLYAAR